MTWNAPASSECAPCRRSKCIILRQLPARPSLILKRAALCRGGSILCGRSPASILPSAPFSGGRPMSLWMRAPIRGCSIVIAAAAAVGLAHVGFAQAQEKVLRAVMHADVRVLDPIWTTQTIANIHGMLVYHTLFGTHD